MLTQPRLLEKLLDVCTQGTFINEVVIEQGEGALMRKPDL